MKYLQKLLAIFLILFSMMIILSGLFNYKENGGVVSVCLVIGGWFILYISSKTLIFNPKSMKNLKGKIRKIELITKYGHEGKIIALKEVYSEKNKQELLKRYNNDYRKINKDEKLVIIDELKERKLILEEEYAVKLNKIREENLIQEKKLEAENERRLNKEKELEEAREKLEEVVENNKIIIEMKNFTIGFVIGVMPISFFYSNIQNIEIGQGIEYTFLILFGLYVVNSLIPLLFMMMIFIIVLGTIFKKLGLAIGIVSPYVILFIYLVIMKNSIVG